MNSITSKTIKLTNALSEEEQCNIEISKDNKFIIRLNKDNKLRYIGSKYSVGRDIEKFLSDIGKIDDNTTIIVFGLGTAEHIRCIMKNLSQSNKVLIIEPNTNIINETIKLDFCRDIFSDNRVVLLCLDDETKKHMNSFIEDYSVDNTKIVSFANYPIIFENEYKLAIDIFNSVKNFKKIGKNTFNAFSDLFFNNFIENIFSLDKFYTVNNLKDLYKSKPAVIVSSGPSLTKNIHLLKEVQDKFIIICGPRTLGTLIKNGINPDFICIVDPQDKIYTLMGKHINLDVPLVFMDSADNKTVKAYKGLKIITANQGMEKHLEDMLGTKVDSIMQGGSVAHFCMGLAAYLGCKTIIFIGQDLAYTNEKFQAEGTYAGEMDELKYRYESDMEKWNSDKNYSIYVNDIYGNKVRTSALLNSYREEFEELISDCNGIKFINSTEGGANIKGAEVIPLKEAINLYASEKINKNLEELIPKPIVIDENEFIEKMLTIVNKVEIIKKACEEGINYSEQMLYFYRDNKPCNLKKVFKELDKIDALINNKEEIGLFAYKLISIINNILQDKEFNMKENQNARETGVRLARRSLKIYLAVFQTVQEMTFIIKNKFVYLKITEL